LTDNLPFQAFRATMDVASRGAYRLVREEADAVEVAAPVTPELLQGDRLVHGGLLATLADTTAVYALLRELWPAQTVSSIEFKLNFLRPAVLEGGELLARASVLRRGRSVAVCEVSVSQGTREVARGLFTYAVSASPEGERS
jgi:uncharacterized protein (TIGR00369 family)